MAFRRREEALLELADFLPVFRDSVLKANKRLLALPELVAFDKGTRSRMVRDLIVSELRLELDGRRGVQVVDGNQTAMICIGQNWVIQVHKLDESGDIARNFTQLAMDLRDGAIPQQLLPNLPAEATVLFLGHVETGDIEHPDVRLVFPGVERWSIGLLDEEPAVEEITPAAQHVADEIGTQVVVKPERERQRKR